MTNQSINKLHLIKPQRPTLTYTNIQTHTSTSNGIILYLFTNINMIWLVNPFFTCRFNKFKTRDTARDNHRLLQLMSSFVFCYRLKHQFSVNQELIKSRKVLAALKPIHPIECTAHTTGGMVYATRRSDDRQSKPHTSFITTILQFILFLVLHWRLFFAI